MIDQADVIEVVYGKRTYQATLIGTDPSTDLAVIKIEADGLPQIETAIQMTYILESGCWPSVIPLT